MSTNAPAATLPAPMPTSAAIAPAELARVFNPRSIVVVGAKEGSEHFMGSGAVVQALERLGFDGDLHLVARSGGTVFGRPTLRSVGEIGAPVDHAALAVRAQVLPGVIAELAGAGIRAATSLASGLAETGTEGARLQHDVNTAALTHGVRLLGPNCLGFLNITERSGIWYSGMPANVRPGGVAILSQSGGMGDALLEHAAERDIGLSHVITTGNEVQVSVTDALGYLVEDPSTRAIAMYAEGLKKRHEFRRIARRARELGKAIVIVKAGASELSARNALSHTGSLVGDDRVVDAVLRQDGVIRAHSLEEALTTAQLIAHLGRITRSGIGVVSLSGGSCSIVADTAAQVGLDLPDFTAETVAKLTPIIIDHATPQNPFDVTGAADEHMFQSVLRIVGEQPDLGAVAVLCNVPTHESGATQAVRDRLHSIGRGMRDCALPSVLLSQTNAHVNEVGRKSASDAGIPLVMPGLHLGTVALQRLAWWSAQLGAPRASLGAGGLPAEDVAADDESGLTTMSEWDSRRLLSDHGVPFVPAHLVTTADEAATAADALGGAVAVKVVSPDLAHKSDIGGVVLDVSGPDAVARAHDTVTTAARTVGASVTGSLVSPMRTSGIELIVGVTRDPQWGLVLLVGLGGVFVEVLADTAIRPLPVKPQEIADMLDELSGRAMLDGVRGAQAADRTAIVDLVTRVAEAATALGEQLSSLELNPVLIDGDRIEALDAVVVLRDTP